MITVTAPAKINLTLEVLGKCPDGYHEIRSVMQMVSLCDELSFECADDLFFSCAVPAWDAEKSLVSRAARVLKTRFNVGGGACINLKKRIPLSSGLGGDSSDAAAVLKGLRQLWNLNIKQTDLADLASSLGSDAPFFLDGPTALTRGRGEIIKPLPAMPHTWVVLMFPALGPKASKTAQLYSMLTNDDYTSGAATDCLMKRLKRGKTARPEDLFNVFEKVALDAFIGLDRCYKEFQRISGAPVHLAGAGPSLFALYRDKDSASKVCNSLEESGFAAHVLETLVSAPVC